MTKNTDDLAKIFGIDINNLSKFMGLDLDLGIVGEVLDITTDAGFTFYDENDDITYLDDYSIKVESPRRDSLSYIRKSYGADYFHNWELEFEVDFNGPSFGDAGAVNIANFSNEDNSYSINHMYNQDDGVCVVAWWWRSEREIRLRNYEDGSYDDVQLLIDKYYFTFKKVDKDLEVKIYSDAARTVLEATLTNSLVNDVSYEYFAPWCSMDVGTQTSEYISADMIGNFKFTQLS